MEQKQYTIPSKEREEWRKLVTGLLDHKFQNFVLQMKTAEYQSKISSGELPLEKAIDELHQLCEKYVVAVQSDFKKIFKDW
ncbi:hypothetical protein JMN32_22335 [Fulvivirga sp. 29W222]|uniref:Uncharacterized protein n=1 Tax=Fulvivirga marina TaxID=2494733 RepID=A0A937G1V0_9BACT|nr:hypothetical protein [Fulvivirga marina]MBL6449067.1 hypothetical protein [Fulvivirga marina]